MTGHTSPPSKSRTDTILLVDDQPDQIRIIKAALDQHFLVKVAIRGELVLPIALEGGIDLILLDILMPEMDGYEVCQQLKAHPETRRIPVIFLTCKDSQDDESLGLDLGAVDFIRKPSSPAVLVARSRNTIAHQRAKRELRRKNEELRQALKIREEVERISHHDIKGPLSSILGLPEILLADSNHTEGQRALLKQIERSGYIILEMLNRSLDLFRMENGTYQLHPATFDLLEVLQYIAGDFEKQNQRRGIRIVIHHPGSGAAFFVMGERMLCYSLFYNLILNAVEASCDHGEISIQLTSATACGVIRITNPGEVPMGIRPHFFDKYVTSGKKDGTGLGTYSARLAAHIQGGMVELDTRQSGKTSLVVTLPQASPPLPDPTAGPTKGLRILLAEDAEENQVLFAAYLTDTAHQLVIVNNGMEAIARIQEEGFDVVVMDIQMPVMDGCTALRRIRQWKQERGASPVPVILLSGHALEEEAAFVRESGCMLYLAKPLRKQPIIEALREIACSSLVPAGEREQGGRSRNSMGENQ
ncbi:MAG: response regulator [Magnetococcales bacterium]|nr:response regulator [Magnetococcales bacterium]